MATPNKSRPAADSAEEVLSRLGKAIDRAAVRGRAQVAIGALIANDPVKARGKIAELNDTDLETVFAAVRALHTICHGERVRRAEAVKEGGAG